MNYRLLFAFLLGVFSAPLSAEDVTMCVDDVCAQILGQSGKITFSFDDEVIKLTMDSLTEVDSDGETVGNTGSTKHSFNSFASQDFTFSELYNTSYEGVDAVGVNFTASLVDATANFEVLLYLFVESGNITNGNETYYVGRGSFKFSYMLDYWPFCTINGSGVTLCTKGQEEQEGAYLDFQVIFKNDNSNVQSHNSSNNTVLVFEDETEIDLPVEYQTSVGWTAMPSGYPRTDIQGSQTFVVFRFGRFEANLDYDPFLNWGGDTSNIIDENAAGITSWHSTISSSICFLMLAVFIIW